MVIRNLENKIKLVGIICSFFLVGCIIISVSSIWTARTMVTDAQKKVYVLDGNVPILVNRTTMDETLDVEAKSHVEMFHHFFFTLQRHPLQANLGVRVLLWRQSNFTHWPQGRHHAFPFRYVNSYCVHGFPPV